MAEVQGLIINLEARTAQLERGLKRASDAQRRAATQMEQRARQSADRMQAAYAKLPEGITASFGKLKGLALPFAGGFIGGLAAGGMAGIVNNIRGVTREVASLGNEARRAGVSAEVFQEWKFLADQNRISVDALVDGFKELSLRADEYIQTGVGPAAEAFGRLGLRAEDLKRKLKDPSALMLEILGRLEGFDKAAQIRIADEVFGGTGGERFVELLGQGQDALRATIARAHETGAVLDAALIARAEELDRKFSELTTTAANFGKRVAVTLAAAGTELVDFRDRLDRIFPDPAQGRAVLGDELYSVLDGDRDLLDANAEAAARLQERYSALGQEARTAANALQGAVPNLNAWGYAGQASALATIAADMRQLATDFDAGAVTADDFGTRMADLEQAATAAFAELEAGDRVEFGGVIGQLSRLAGVIAGVTSLANTLTGALQRAAGIAPDQKATDALRQRHEAEAQSLANWNAMSESNARFTASEQARNDATTEALRLEREVEAVRKRAKEAGATLTDGQAQDMAAAALAGEAARQAADRAAREAGGAGGGARLDDFAREVQAIRDRTMALQTEAMVLATVAVSQRRQGDAVEFARIKTDLLVAAQQAGHAITPELEAGIDRLADSYINMAAQAEKARDAASAMQKDAQAGAGALADLFMSGLDGADAFKAALLDLARTILRNQIINLFTAIPGMGKVGALLRPGFAEGGWTGPGTKYQPAGIVHANEYVFSAEAVNRIGAGNLDAMHRAAKSGAVGYASGGLVDVPARVMKAASGRPVESAAPSAPNITLAPTINVNATGGTPDQNADLARQISDQTERAMRGLIQQELVRQMRPGGILR